MESKADIYKGYHEARTPHYYAWEKAQSTRYFEYRKKWENNAKNLIVENYPLHLDIGITNVCNLECTFCARTVLINEGKFRESAHMDFELYQSIIDQAVELGTFSINLNLLNEPITNPNLIKMIKYAKEKGIVDVHFHSHGGLLTERKSIELIESGLDKILISIDTPNKQKYEKLRVLSKFDSVISNIKKFKEIRDEGSSVGPLIKCNFIEFPGITKEEMKDNLEFGLTLADCVGFQEYIDPTCTVGEKKSYQPNYKSSFICQQPFTRIAIAEDGTASPCCLDHQFELSVGNAKEKSLKELWNSEGMKNMRKTQLEGKFYEIPRCRNCEMATNGDEGIPTQFEKYGPTL
tara:strand:+ start:611 stop:1657 length:1047 start_codon:yes stop_codon:yes gene_type:complete